MLDVYTYDNYSYDTDNLVSYEEAIVSADIIGKDAFAAVEEYRLFN